MTRHVGELVDDAEHAELAPVVGAVLDEVIGPAAGLTDQEALDRISEAAPPSLASPLSACARLATNEPWSPVRSNSVRCAGGAPSLQASKSL